MIRMGMAKAYDFKLLLPMLGMLYLGLMAACLTAAKDKPQAAEPSKRPAPAFSGG